MKKIQSILVALVALVALSANAQQVTTLYFLENAPMRHTLNPALQPVSRGYINFTPLGWTSMSFGNNSLTMRDVLFVDPTTRKTITPLHPNADKGAFLRSLHSMTLIDGSMTFSWFNMGLRIKENGYLMIGINQHIDLGGTLPKPGFEFLLGGGMSNLNADAVNSFNLAGFGAGGTMYTEIGAGYSHRLDEHWTIGGKLKFLLGTMDMSGRAKMLGIDASTEAWRIKGDMALEMAGPLNFDAMPDMGGRRLIDVIHDIETGGAGGEYSLNNIINMNNIPGLLKPNGYGAAIDFGFAWKPIENLQVTGAINDLGFIYWTNSRKYTASMDTTFNGVGTINYSDPAYHNPDGSFNTQALGDSLINNIMGLANNIILHPTGRGYAKMVTARLNIGLDANFWENRVGVGIVSATRLYNARLYEEVTFGVSFRPVHWFNIAATYSLMNNGKYSNIGAGLSFMPYDGINLTLAMDYIPTSYAKMPNSNSYIIPDKAKMVNLAFGFSICWGTNRKDSDKDGIWDKIDMCPETPRGVAVDSVGCPVDEDHDGVPDYLDHCLGTPAAAIGLVDSVGCPLDTDEDGVPDYLDECPNTPRESFGIYLDERGCPRDTDGDGVPDYKDKCPDTPEAAWGLVDEDGCPLDSDDDGVPDYLDECPETTIEALGFVDENGCELDSDGDGVPDYKDECPYSAGVKANKGCPEVKREVRLLLQKAMQGIEFETGKATIKSKSFPLLDQIAETFIENTNYLIEVQGHTDNVGKEAVNRKLSDKRANAVMDYLVKKGVPADRMTAVGYGPDVPIADNSTKAGRAKNRRVEFNITFEEVHIETILDHAD